MLDVTFASDVTAERSETGGKWHTIGDVQDYKITFCEDNSSINTSVVVLLLRVIITSSSSTAERLRKLGDFKGWVILRVNFMSKGYVSHQYLCTIK